MPFFGFDFYNLEYYSANIIYALCISIIANAVLYNVSGNKLVPLTSADSQPIQTVARKTV